MNKPIVFAVSAAAGAALFFSGIGIGICIGTLRQAPAPAAPPPPVQSSPATDQTAQRLKAEAELYDEIANRSAAEADAFRTFARQRIEDLDRLEILAAYDRLYDVEKIEIGKIIDRLAADFPAIRNDYSRETGRVKNLSEWVRKIKEADRAAAIRLRQKAVDDAKIAAEKQMEVLKQSSERLKRSAR